MRSNVSGTLILLALLLNQFHWHAGSYCVVYFGHCIGFAQQLGDGGTRRRRRHGRFVFDVGSGQANAGKLRSCLYFDAFN